MTLSEKIIKIISVLGLNNKTFAEKLEVTRTTIDAYTVGRKKGDVVIISKPTYDVLFKMIEVFNINPFYLFRSSTDMFILNKEKTNPNILQFVIDSDKKNYDSIINYCIENKDDLCRSEKYKDHVIATAYELQGSLITKELKNKLDKIEKQFLKKKD